MPDPLRSVGWNRYAYTGNNPVRFVDPSGHQVGCATLVELGMDPAECIPEGGSGGFGGGEVGGLSGRSLVGGAAATMIAAGVRYGVKQALETFPGRAPEIPPLPGTTLQDTPEELITPDIKPCSDPNQGLETFPSPQGQTIDDLISADPIGPGIELPNVFEATLDDILRDTIPGPDTKGRSVNRLKYGGFEDALRDFNSLDDLSIIGSYPGGVIVGELPGGIKVNVRPGSLFGDPTLEIQRGKRKIKIRYVEE